MTCVVAIAIVVARFEGKLNEKSGSSFMVSVRGNFTYLLEGISYTVADYKSFVVDRLDRQFN